ncbi:MAG TPA: universal stress protein [Albitalea sp.]
MNSIRSVLVHVDAAPSSAARLQVARQVAAPHEALVTALYAVTPSVLQVPFAGEAASAAVSLLQELDNERLQRAKACFREATCRPGCAVHWAELGDEPVIAGFVHEALCADLLVLGQRASGDAFSRDVPADFAEAVMLSSGRPAIVVPDVPDLPLVGRRIVIAWKSSRECARAVSGALPVLQRAETVQLVHWSEAHSESHSPLGIERYLRLHGVEPTRHDMGIAHRVGQAALAFSANAGADLLVMGCYGHSRARELVLGGATREVLREARLPVLMAH